tara:strand:- start:3415 stop:4293 length:879 start_codon:yes stop_codon:yes gene_type:complete
MLLHPQSVDLLPKKAFNTKFVECIRISCGTTKNPYSDLSEAGDFSPTYATWNSALFETSMILTVWEHANELIGNNHVAIIHSDVELHFKASETWKKINKALDDNPTSSIALTIPVAYRGLWDDWLVPDSAMFIPNNDPYKIHCFDNKIHVWDLIKEYDAEIHDWAFDTQPKMIYSHQFACSRETFEYLGNRLYNIASKLRLRDIGFWTPHMFERLIALYLAHYGEPVLTTAFFHYQSSGVYGPGDHNLYGPRPLRFYHTVTKAGNRALASEKKPPEIQTNSDQDPLETLFRC